MTDDTRELDLLVGDLQHEIKALKDSLNFVADEYLGLKHALEHVRAVSQIGQTFEKEADLRIAVDKIFELSTMAVRESDTRGAKVLRQGLRSDGTAYTNGHA